MKLSKEKLDFISENVGILSDADIAGKLGITILALNAYKKIALHNKQEYLKSSERNELTDIQREWIMKNANLYANHEMTVRFNSKFGTDYSSKNLSDISRRWKIDTNSSRKHKKTGEESLRKNILYVKTDAGWKRKDHLMLEKYYGMPVKSDERIIHLDQDPFNCSIDNLKIVDKDVFSFYLRSRTEYPELNKTIVLISEIKNKVKGDNNGRKEE